MPLSAFRHLPVLAAFLFPVLVVFQKNFISVYLVLLAGAVVVLVRPFTLRFWTPLIAAIGALALLCLLSALWSIDPADSAIRFIRLGLEVAGGVVLCALAAGRDFEGRKDAMTAFAAGLLAAGVIAVISHFGWAVLPPGRVATFLHQVPVLAYGAVAALLTFVLVATTAERPMPAVVPVAIVASALAVLLSGNNASKIALVLGIGAVAVFFWIGRKAILAAAVVLPVLFLALPVAVHTSDVAGFLKAHGWTPLYHSATHRLIIGRYVMGKIEERPVLGWGLNSSRMLPDRDAPVFGNPRYADLMGLTKFAPGTKIELMPLHPHNATLQTWLELGALGPLLYAALYALVLVGINRIVASRLARAAGGGAVVAAFVIGQISFNVWQSWWLIAQFLTAALFLYSIPKRAPVTPRDDAIATD